MRSHIGVLENKKKLTIVNRDKINAWNEVQKKLQVEGNSVIL